MNMIRTKEEIFFFFFLIITSFFVSINQSQTILFTLKKKETFKISTKYFPMYKLWQDIINFNLSQKEINSIFNEFYPYSTMKQKVFFFNPNKRVGKYNEQGIYGTAQIQKLIYGNQFPKDCLHRNFLVINHFEKSMAGIGAMLHIISGFIGMGLDENRTVIYYPNSSSLLSSKNFCIENSGLDCFLSKISNCSFSKRQIDSNHQKFKKISIRNFTGFFYYPQSIIPILQKSASPVSKYNLCWKIQALFFLVRFNENMKFWLNDFKTKNLINSKDQYDVAINVRHGDKHLEMLLIDTKDYIYPLEILHKLLDRKLFVFISSDDESAIQFLLKLNKDKYDISYINQTRSPKGFFMQKNLKNGFNQSIFSFSDLSESIKANYLIGTLSSNWNRLILELRLQYGSYMNLPYFEVGNNQCVTPNQCKLYNIPMD